MSYLEDKVNSLQDKEYRKALTYTASSAAVTSLFGAASVERMLDGDFETAKQSALVAGFSGTVTKGLYNRTQELEEEINEDIFDNNSGGSNDVNEYDMEQVYWAD